MVQETKPMAGKSKNYLKKSIVQVLKFASYSKRKKKENKTATSNMNETKEKKYPFNRNGYATKHEHVADLCLTAVNIWLTMYI